MNTDIELPADVIAEIGANRKVSAIKLLRAHQRIGLKEAKELVESAPKAVKEGVPKDEAQKIQEALTKAGATAEVK